LSYTNPYSYLYRPDLNNRPAPLPLLQQQRLRGQHGHAQKVQAVPHHQVLRDGHAPRLDHDGRGAGGEAQEDPGEPAPQAHRLRGGRLLGRRQPGREPRQLRQ